MSLLKIFLQLEFKGKDIEITIVIRSVALWWPSGKLKLSLLLFFLKMKALIWGLLDDSFYTHFLSWPYRRRVRKT